MILESIVSTLNADGSTHIAPLGLHVDGESLIIAPYRPSRTLDNLERSAVALVNWTTDVKVFAGAVTGRRTWPLEDVPGSPLQRLQSALTHAELTVTQVEAHDERPRFICRVERTVTHAPYRGFVRAEAAVIEAAILATRLNRLPKAKVEEELRYLQIAIDKTAGPNEREAWSWLMDVFTPWLKASP
jgi:hypothetical protein